MESGKREVERKLKKTASFFKIRGLYIYGDIRKVGGLEKKQGFGRADLFGSQGMPGLRPAGSDPKSGGVRALQHRRGLGLS